MVAPGKEPELNTPVGMDHLYLTPPPRHPSPSHNHTVTQSHRHTITPSHNHTITQSHRQAIFTVFFPSPRPFYKEAMFFPHLSHFWFSRILFALFSSIHLQLLFLIYSSLPFPCIKSTQICFFVFFYIFFPNLSHFLLLYLSLFGCRLFSIHSLPLFVLSFALFFTILLS